MISRDLLKEIGRRTGLHLYHQEKDYMLKLFLNYYYGRYDDAVFKGGTCLRYVFGTRRFSEDLDFDIIVSPSVMEGQVIRTLNEIKLIGIDSGFIRNERFKDAFTCDVWFHGPLYRGSKQTRNRFRIDAGRRGGILNPTRWVLIPSEYPETRNRILVRTMDEEEILAEKVETLLSRGKGRDLYDVWFLLNSGVGFNMDIFLEKMKGKDPGERIPVSRKEYNRDMENLVSRVIPYDQLMLEVGRDLGSIFDR